MTEPNINFCEAKMQASLVTRSSKKKEGEFCAFFAKQKCKRASSHRRCKLHIPRPGTSARPRTFRCTSSSKQNPLRWAFVWILYIWQTPYPSSRRMAPGLIRSAASPLQIEPTLLDFNLVCFVNAILMKNQMISAKNFQFSYIKFDISILLQYTICVILLSFGGNPLW